MAPEQVKGQPIDGRSDIFAAGILLWELICGEKLFTGDSDFAILEKVRTGCVLARAGGVAAGGVRHGLGEGADAAARLARDRRREERGHAVRSAPAQRG